MVAVIDPCRGANRLLLQFHITGQCNLRCKHCYRAEGDVEPLSLENVLDVLEQFKDLRTEYNRRHGIRRKGHINLTGGEPFFRKDICDILRYLKENKEHFTFGILSNGSFITEEIIGLLLESEISFIQLSLDGDRATHDSLRATGDYDRVLTTAERLEKRGIRTYISFTANKENYRHLPHVAKECRRRGITKLWSDRLVPIGGGKELKALAITDTELPDYINQLKKARGSALTRLCFPRSCVTLNRALQFQGSPGAIYSCSAGSSLITVDEFGNVMPCRRMPIPCGNVLETPLKEIYFSHDVFRSLRRDVVPAECAACRYALLCRGGAKCQSYAQYGSFYRADPACPLCKSKESAT